MKAALIVLLAGAALVAAGALGAWQWTESWLDTPMALEADEVLHVVPGSAFSSLCRDLHARGWIEHPRVLAAWARLREFAPRIKAGEYRVERGTTPRGLVGQLVAGEVILHQLTIIEGWTFRQALAQIQAHEAVRVTLAGADDASIMAALDMPGEHPEGRFYPDTYRFARGTTDLRLLERAAQAMQARLEAHWASREPGLPLDSAYEALVLASIVEKETGLASERARIAGVFVNRLRAGMRLQSDPTVIYGLGERYDGDIRTRDLRTDTPYNTYTRGGLPPTPIALPGDGALAAATRPLAGPHLYFVASPAGDGSHYFSTTLEEHNRAVQRYLRAGRKNTGGDAVP